MIEKRSTATSELESKTIKRSTATFELESNLEKQVVVQTVAVMTLSEVVVEGRSLPRKSEKSVKIGKTSRPFNAVGRGRWLARKHEAAGAARLPRVSAPYPVATDRLTVGRSCHQQSVGRGRSRGRGR